MILLEAVIEDSNYDALAGVAHLPSGHNVEIKAVASATILLDFNGRRVGESGRGEI